MNKIKQLFMNRGWYNFPKPVRHISASLILAWVVVWIVSWFTKEYNFILGALASYIIGFIKELVENKGFNNNMGYDLVLNLFGVLLSMVPWFIELGM